MSRAASCAARPLVGPSWFTNERLAILGALLLALLSAPQRAERRRQQLRRSGRSRGAAARTPTSERRSSRVTPVSAVSAREDALEQLHRTLQEGDAVRAAILIETWGQGVSLDWSVTNDCRANFGRYALDSALEVLVKETRNEQVALSLLSIGQGSGQGDTSQLDADPLMRAAAAQGMTRLVERLVKDCGASVNSKERPEQTALKLLQLGADPFAGRGVGYILARAGPEVRAQLPTTSVAREEVPTDLSEADFEQLRQRLPKISERGPRERMVLQELQSKRLSKVQLAQLLQEAARLGFRPRLLEHLCEGLERQQVPLNWDQASVLDAAFARRPLDAALETAVEENPDARAAVWLLDEGIKNSNGRKSRLNANPLLRTAASRCQVPLIERLVEINAEASLGNPRYGSTALDRAVSAGCTGAALTLLSLGADPDAGHGRRSLLERAKFSPLHHLLLGAAQ
eukprot:g15849.t1